MKKLLRWAAWFAIVSSVCSAQAPAYYGKVARLTWVVRSLDKPLQGWSRLGLANVQGPAEVRFSGEYRGHLNSGVARVASGSLGGMAVDFVEPGTGDNAFNDFLARRGDGVFAIVHEAPSADAVTAEIARLRGLGVAVLQQVTVDSGAGPATFTFFDTEPKGKYVLGLVYWSAGMPAASGGLSVSHLAFAARELESVSAFWEKLGFPAVHAVHASPREDSRYHGAPLWLAFDVGWDGHTKPGAEWIVPPRTPSNCYDDFLKAHGEGVHHFGVPVDDLEKATAEYRTLGYSVLQAGAWGEVGRKDSGRYHYMDTDSIGGVVVELIRAYK